MKPPPLQKILFLAASGLDDAEARRVLLEKACHDDPGLRKAVEELLETQESAADFFEARPTAGVSAAEGNAEDLGARIGRYRLIDRIGAGGWGVVYLAEQDEPVRRKVALKIIRLGMDTESVIARFDAERQALALMDHPNIARVFDSGATISGRPYFVMELVDGDKITDFCDTHRFGIRERLEIFVQVCHAIQHAHHKGVIHRDIKPSNILVRMHDDVPAPKVIDFGIAKAAVGNTSDDLALTASDQWLGTPAYMSPELATGGMDLDTRSDIHSLGVVLFELITGRTPICPERIQKLGMDGIRRVLREEDLPKPSVLLAAMPPGELEEIAAHRGVDGAKLLHLVKGELDWMVTKAMERDRDRRYQTANDLAADVQRYLRCEPVSAGPPDRLYRLAKLVRRNKVPFVFGTLAIVALIGGFGISTTLLFRENEARREQERLRVQADRARANEAHLRERAEHRELIAQAAVQISHGDIATADKLLARIPFGEAPPSLEVANSYSKVGEWHVLAGRWQQATDRYASLALALAQVDPSDSDAISITLIPAAAMLCQQGDRARYDSICRLAVERFAKTTSPVVAEQVLKTALLLPAEQGSLNALKPFAVFLEQAIAAGDGELANMPGRVAWCSFALALMKYREGDMAAALEWANRSWSVAVGNSSREASIRCLIAMIEYRLGHRDRARVLLASAQSEIDGVFSKPLALGDVNSFWFDWVNARIHFREASALVGE